MLGIERAMKDQRMGNAKSASPRDKTEKLSKLSEIDTKTQSSPFFLSFISDITYGFISL